MKIQYLLFIVLLVGCTVVRVKEIKFHGNLKSSQALNGIIFIIYNDSMIGVQVDTAYFNKFYQRKK